MKKLFKIFAILCISVMAICIPCVVASAEEVVDDETVEEVVEETVEEELTLNDYKEIAKGYAEEYLSKFLEASTVERIISWIFDGTALVALVGVYLKYRKYKHNNLDDMVKSVDNALTTYLKENFDNLSKEQIQPLLKGYDEVKKEVETVMKVLVLMQDNTADGKVALIEYLGSKTDNKEVKESIEEVKAVVEEQKTAEQVVKDKVAGDYEKIF